MVRLKPGTPVLPTVAGLVQQVADLPRLLTLPPTDGPDPNGAKWVRREPGTKRGSHG